MKRTVSVILFLTLVISLPAQEILHLYNGNSVNIVNPHANVSGSQSKAIKSGRDMFINGGDITVSDRVLSLTAIGECNKHLVTGSTYDSFSSTCLKSDANIIINGGSITAAAGGRTISCAGTFTMGTVGAADSQLTVNVKTNGTEVVTYKMPTVSNGSSGFEDTGATVTSSGNGTSTTAH